MIRIDEEIRTAVDNALADRVPCILATALPDGHPSVGHRGSVLVFTDDTLAYWERTMRAGLEHVEANPQVVIMYRNPATRQAWKFFGRATVHRDGEVRERVLARVVQQELDRDPDRRGFAVTVELDRIQLMNGELLQARD